MPRFHWHQLPSAARSAVEARTGAVGRVLPVRAGSVADMTAILHTERGEVFCKAVRETHRLAWLHRREAGLNPHLPAFAPRLRWHVEAVGWILLGFDKAPGRHLDVTPGSPDLPRLAGTLTAMAGIRAPRPPVRIQPATTRWAGYLTSDVVDGDTLVHTDMNTANFLVDPMSIAVVDWAMPCRGAAWIDTALMVVRLIRAGHTPEEAEKWAASVPAWRNSPPKAVTAFAGACAVRGEEWAERSPAPHFRELADAGHDWARFRRQQ
ncbi:phosphotransferase [Actinoplanes sp. G11-F43]|uniref:phosphotransferase n=1 Tax=Actinoplanes sp. G11-F43 TaxID=3424130 RepID=UPI003D33B032